jgi:dnd system-associated protein 4
MRRIQRDSKHEDFIKFLCSPDGGGLREIWRVLILASAIGVKYGLKKPLKNIDSNRSIPDQYFSNPSWPGYLFLVGFIRNDGSDCLKDTKENEEELLKDFEEYANGGIEWMKEKIENSNTCMDGLLSIFMGLKKDEAADVNLENLI